MKEVDAFGEQARLHNRVGAVVETAEQGRGAEQCETSEAPTRGAMRVVRELRFFTAHRFIEVQQTGCKGDGEDRRARDDEGRTAPQLRGEQARHHGAEGDADVAVDAVDSKRRAAGADRA